MSPCAKPPPELAGLDGLQEMWKQKDYVIYFLIHKNKVVYIGFTKNLLSRYVGHQTNGFIKFDRVAFIHVGAWKKNAMWLERQLILAFKPRHNCLTAAQRQEPKGEIPAHLLVPKTRKAA